MVRQEVNALPTSSANISATTDFRTSGQHSTAEGLHPEGKGPLATGGLASTSSEVVQLVNGITADVAQAPVQRDVGGLVGGKAILRAVSGNFSTKLKFCQVK